jgi:hypothetical protein
VARVLETGASTRDAMAAMTELARSLPAALGQHVHSANQTQAQAAQALKLLSSRLENVASGIESSGRKTLETVAARMLQSEANMVSRHHAVAEHLGEVVQRIEALCGLLRHDEAQAAQPGGLGYDAAGYDAPLFEASGRYPEASPARRSAHAPGPRYRDANRAPAFEYEDGNPYDDGEYAGGREIDGRYDRHGDGGSFGS